MKKKKKINEIFKSYELVQKANLGKLNLLQNLYKIYTQEYRKYTLQYWKKFIQNKITNNKFSHLGSTKEIVSPLNASYVQGCLAQSCASLNSYLSQIELKFSLILGKSSIKNKDSLHQLRTINIQHAWLNKSLCYYPSYDYHVVDDFGNLIKSNPVKMEMVISEENLKLAKRIFKQIIHRRVRFPNLNKPRLLIDSRVYTLEESKTSSFDYWLNITTLEKRKRVSIPIKSNDFFKNASGELGKTIELNFQSLDYEKTIHHYQSLEKPKLSHKNKSLKKQGLQKVNQTLTITFNKKHTLEEYSNQFLKDRKIQNITKDRTVAFDLGLCNFLATSDGDLKGSFWLDKLKQYDKQITELAAYRQSRGLKTRSKRYDNLIQRVRGFIKSNINSILNDYFDKHQDIKTIIVENLHFNNPALSKKLNRIIKNFGLGIFKSKLSDLSLLYGFTIQELNPAYSSQQCENCGYISPNNRPQQAVFKCQCCGKELHADVQSSRSLLKRFQSTNPAFQSLHKSTILRELKLEFSTHIKALLSHGLVGRRKLYHLLKNNIYFKRDFDFASTAKVSGLKPMTFRNFDEILPQVLKLND